MENLEDQSTHPARVAIYARVSTDEQAERQTPIRTQLELSRRLAADKFGPEAAIREFVDEGHSGRLGLRKAPDQRSGFRPALTEVCAAMAAGEVEAIVVQDADRLARDEYVMLELINDYFKRYDVQLLDSNGEVDLQSPEGLLMCSVTAAVAAFYPRLNARKVKAGLEQRAREGYLMTRAGYGWRRQENQEIPAGSRRGVERMAQQGVWVRQMKDWYLAGWGSAKIARQLNEQGVPSPAGGTWGLSSVITVLDNPAHAGLVRLPNGEGHTKGRHFPRRYYEPEDFDEIQQVRRRKTRKRGKFDTSPFILGGTAVCGACGRHLVGATHPTARFYHCSPRDDYDRRPCVGVTIRAEHLEHAVVQHLKELAASEAMQRLLGEQREALVAQQGESLRAQLQSHQEAVEQIERTRGKLFNLLRRERVSEEEYGLRSRELEQEAEAVLRTCAELESRLKNERLRKAHVRRVGEILADFDRAWDILADHEKRRMVEIVMESVSLHRHQQGTRVVIRPHFLPEQVVIIPRERLPNRPRFGPEALTMRQLAALALYAEGLTPQQIAQRWQTTAGNVYTQLQAARDRLQVAANEEAAQQARPLIRQFWDYLPLEGRDGEPKGNLKLTPRQQEVLKLMAHPKRKYSQMAKKLGLSVGAVKYHAHQLMKKFGVNRRQEAIAKARKLGHLSEAQLPPGVSLPPTE